jgi:hypothetical protein
VSGFGNWMEPSGLISERLDATITEQDQLAARVTTLIRILEEKGVLTRDEVARIADAAREAEPRRD